MKEKYIATINELRKNIDMDKAHKLVKININDPIYKIGVMNYDFIYEDINYLFNTYTNNYAISICNVYIELLENCQKSEVLWLCKK